MVLSHTQDKDADSTGHGNTIPFGNTPSVQIITGKESLAVKGNRHTRALARP